MTKWNDNDYIIYTIEYNGKVVFFGCTNDYPQTVQKHKYNRGTGDSAIPICADLTKVKFTPYEAFWQLEKDAQERVDELVQQYKTNETGWNT